MGSRGGGGQPRDSVQTWSAGLAQGRSPTSQAFFPRRQDGEYSSLCARFARWHHAGASPRRQHGLVTNTPVRRLHRWGRQAGLPEALGALQSFGEGTSSCSPSASRPSMSLHPCAEPTDTHQAKATPLTCPLKSHSKLVPWPKPLFLAVPVPLPGRRRAQSLQGWSFFHIVTVANL